MPAQIYKSLTDKILIAGVPREVAILNGTISAAIVFALQVIVWIAVAILLHVVAVRLTKHDVDWFLVFRRAIRFKGFYDE